MTEFFTELPYVCGILGKLQDLCEGGEWQDYYNFKAKLVPNELLQEEELFRSIKADYQAGILRMDPYTVYNWHIDDKRKMSINMLLSHGDSHCLFTKESGINIPVTELVYAPHKYYILNTKMPHMVVNLDKPRYMFSVEFLDD